jgi:hypothetical protein
MKKLEQLFGILAGILALCVVTFTTFGQAGSTEKQSAGVPENEKPKYTADGQLIPFSPDARAMADSSRTGVLKARDKRKWEKQQQTKSD